MEIHRLETTLREGVIHIENVPLTDGEVEVIVQRKPSRYKPDPDNPYPLRGTVYRYDDPFGPAVPPEEWEALRDDPSE